MKQLRSILVNGTVAVFAIIGAITVMIEIRNPRPWWITRWPLIANNVYLLNDCSALLKKYPEDYYNQFMTSLDRSLFTNRDVAVYYIPEPPQAIRALHPTGVHVILGQGVIIQLGPGKGPTYGYIVIPSRQGREPIPREFIRNGRYIWPTEYERILKFKDTW